MKINCILTGIPGLDALISASERGPSFFVFTGGCGVKKSVDGAVSWDFNFLSCGDCSKKTASNSGLLFFDLEEDGTERVGEVARTGVELAEEKD